MQKFKDRVNHFPDLIKFLKLECVLRSPPTPPHNDIDLYIPLDKYGNLEFGKTLLILDFQRTGTILMTLLLNLFTGIIRFNSKSKKYLLDLLLDDHVCSRLCPHCHLYKHIFYWISFLLGLQPFISISLFWPVTMVDIPAPSSCCLFPVCLALCHLSAGPVQVLSEGHLCYTMWFNWAPKIWSANSFSYLHLSPGIASVHIPNYLPCVCTYLCAVYKKNKLFTVYWLK